MNDHYDAYDWADAHAAELEEAEAVLRDELTDYVTSIARREGIAGAVAFLERDGALYTFTVGTRHEVSVEVTRDEWLATVYEVLPADEPPTCEVCDAPLGAYVEVRDVGGQMVKVCLRCADRDEPAPTNAAEDRANRGGW